MFHRVVHTVVHALFPLQRVLLRFLLSISILRVKKEEDEEEETMSGEKGGVGGGEPSVY